MVQFFFVDVTKKTSQTLFFLIWKTNVLIKLHRERTSCHHELLFHAVFNRSGCVFCSSTKEKKKKSCSKELLPHDGSLLLQDITSIPRFISLAKLQSSFYDCASANLAYFRGDQTVYLGFFMGDQTDGVNLKRLI